MSATIAITLDLHANLPPALTELVDVVIGLHEYPHVDMAGRAARAARTALARARGAVGAIYDPQAVRRATETGVGGSAAFALGGHHGWASGEPLEVAARVVALTDGHVICTSMRKGHALEFGPCVVVVKSSHHFRSGFAHLAPLVVSADATGLTSSRLESFPPRANAAFWPLDPAQRYPR